MKLEVLEAEVLQLGPADRSHLLERPIASLDSDPEVEEAWEREADRREAELESGVIATVPGTKPSTGFEQGFHDDRLQLALELAPRSGVHQ